MTRPLVNKILRIAAAEECLAQLSVEYLALAIGVAHLLGLLSVPCLGSICVDVQLDVHRHDLHQLPFLASELRVIVLLYRHTDAVSRVSDNCLR